MRRFSFLRLNDVTRLVKFCDVIRWNFCNAILLCHTSEPFWDHWLLHFDDAMFMRLRYPDITHCYVSNSQNNNLNDLNMYFKLCHQNVISMERFDPAYLDQNRSKKRDTLAIEDFRWAAGIRESRYAKFRVDGSNSVGTYAEQDIKHWILYIWYRFTLQY